MGFQDEDVAESLSQMEFTCGLRVLDKGMAHPMLAPGAAREVGNHAAEFTLCINGVLAIFRQVERDAALL